VLVVEPRRRRERDEELAAVSVRPAVGHGENPGLVVPQLRAELVGEGETGAAGSLAQRIPALNHEIGDDAVENGAVIVRLLHFFPGPRVGPFKSSFSEPGEVGHGLRHFGVEQPRREVAFARREMREQH
jgi:hypothetical protein